MNFLKPSSKFLRPGVSKQGLRYYLVVLGLSYVLTTCSLMEQVFVPLAVMPAVLTTYYLLKVLFFSK